MFLLISTTAHLQPRFVLPPSMYIQGAKLSAKLIAAIVLLVVIAALLSVCTCYCCYKRHKSKARARYITSLTPIELFKKVLI